jgi:uncharacterized protein YbaA (DUF1428 family)
MPYVDGFAIAVPKDRLDAYRAFSRKACEVWTEHGAAFIDCIGGDIPEGELAAFPHALQTGEDEVAVLSWIVYETREHRDEVNAKALADPRLHEGAFDGERLIRQALHTAVEV